jgi:hypothetical protein
MKAEVVMHRSALLLLVAVFLVADPTLSPQEPYFPKGSLSDNPRSDQSRSDWYSNDLKALQEPSLLQLAKNSSLESYRFVWLRTFHHPVIVRLDLAPDGTGQLTTKVSSGAGGYDPGHLVENKARPVTREATERFLTKVKQEQFWKLPSYETPATVGCDGSQWIIEGFKDGKYHVIDRWTPSKGPVHALGLTFVVELAGMKIPRDELY